MDAPALGRSAWLWFAAWVAIGAAYAVALLGAMTIGLFVAPLAVAATVLITRHRRARVGLPGLLSGAGLPLVYVAWLNRDGPGTVCSVTRGGGSSCTDEWSPWPWLTVAVVLVVVGTVAFRLRRGDHERT
jgi:amino acid transporter